MTPRTPNRKAKPGRVSPRPRWQKWGLGLLLAGLLSLVLFRLTVEFGIWMASSDVPDVHHNAAFVELVPQTSRVTAADGTLLAEFYVERRTIAELEQISPLLVQAVLAVEDKGFRGHAGVDTLAILKASIADALAGRLARGGSTLTQQLAKNLYLTHEKTLWRKLREAAIARKIESELTKEDILFQYLNLIYWGHGNFGVQEAAMFYFGKGADQLDLPEAALLAGIIRSPERLSPVKAPDKAAVRLRVALGEMAELGLLPEGQREFQMPTIVGQRPVRSELAPYGVDAALVQLRSQVTLETLQTQGLRIHTTLVPEVQAALNDAVDSVLPSMNMAASYLDVPPQSACDCLKEGRLLPGCPAWAKIVRRDLNGDLIVDLLGTSARIPVDSLAPPPLDMNWVSDLRPERWIRVMPVHEILVANPWNWEEATAVPLLEPQVAGIVVELATGRILALYGGVDFVHFPFNRALPSPPLTSPSDVASWTLAAQPGGKTLAALTLVSALYDKLGMELAFPPLLPAASPEHAESKLQSLDPRHWFVQVHKTVAVVLWCGSDRGTSPSREQTAKPNLTCANRVGEEVVARLNRLNSSYIPQGNGPK